MKNLFFVFGITLIYFNLLSASNSAPVSNYLEEGVEHLEALYNGGQIAFQQYCQQNLIYPELARDLEIEGRIVVQVDLVDGMIHNVWLVQGLGFGLDEEAIRLVKNSKEWKFHPGKTFSFIMNIQFILDPY